MTDYSKPIGWWCPACKDNVGGRWRGAGCGGRPIPVYAVIPEGERPEGETRAEMEAHAEVVVAVDETETVRLVSPKEEWKLENRAPERWAVKMPFTWGLCAPMDFVEFSTEADAVLWVVEGRLPK